MRTIYQYIVYNGNATIDCDPVPFTKNKHAGECDARPGGKEVPTSPRLLGFTPTNRCCTTNDHFCISVYLSVRAVLAPHRFAIWWLLSTLLLVSRGWIRSVSFLTTRIQTRPTSIAPQQEWANRTKSSALSEHRDQRYV